MTYNTQAIINTLTDSFFSNFDWDAYTQQTENIYKHVVARAIGQEFEARYGLKIDVRWDSEVELFYIPSDDAWYTAEQINNRLQLGRDKDKLEFGGIWFPWDDYTPCNEQHWEAFIQMSEGDFDSMGLFDDLDDSTEDDGVIYGDDDI